jgi:hypothetical protein
MPPLYGNEPTLKNKLESGLTAGSRFAILRMERALPLLAGRTERPRRDKKLIKVKQSIERIVS